MQHLFAPLCSCKLLEVGLQILGVKLPHCFGRPFRRLFFLDKPRDCQSDKDFQPIMSNEFVLGIPWTSLAACICADELKVQVSQVYILAVNEPSQLVDHICKGRGTDAHQVNHRVEARY